MASQDGPSRNTRSQSDRPEDSPSETIPSWAAQLLQQQTALTNQMTAFTNRVAALEARSSSSDRREYSVEQPDSTQDSIPVAVPQPPPQNTSTTVSDIRFRPEELGYFNGTATDAKPFTDHLKDVAAIKGPRILQTNLVQLLLGKAAG